jgi:hypothetical protein
MNHFFFEESKQFVVVPDTQTFFWEEAVDQFDLVRKRKGYGILLGSIMEIRLYHIDQVRFRSS